MTKKQNTTTSGTPPKRTAEELDLLAVLTRLEGRELTEQEANLAIAQARQLGELDDEVPAVKRDDQRTVEALKTVIEAVKKSKS